MQLEGDKHEPDRPVSRSVLFACLGVGELLRLLALAVIADAWLPGGDPALRGAWLLLFLSPHIAVASSFIHIARSPRSFLPLFRIALPAKVIGLLAATIIASSELASGSSLRVTLPFPDSSIPVWFLLALAVLWDLGALAALIVARIEERESVPPASSAGSGGPAFRESDVEVVDGSPGSDPSP